jgi:integrase
MRQAKEGASLRVERQLLPVPSGTAFGPPKSKRSRRTIALDEETVEALRKHRDAQVLEQDFAGEAYEHNDLVFASPLGERLHSRAISERFTVLRKQAKITVGSIHVLRHTAATLELGEGQPVHKVAAELGDDPATLLRTYAHHVPRRGRSGAHVVAAALVDKALTNRPKAP